jgi:hypothetical protein
VSLTCNARPAAAKRALFEATASNLEHDPGLPRADLFMNIVEVAPENWWAHARTTDPVSGTDSRMTSKSGT